jgi:hypothetical protein
MMVLFLGGVLLLFRGATDAKIKAVWKKRRDDEKEAERTRGSEEKTK